MRTMTTLELSAKLDSIDAGDVATLYHSRLGVPNDLSYVSIVELDEE